MCQLRVLILKIWNKEEIPANLRDGLIVASSRRGTELIAETTEASLCWPLMGKASPVSLLAAFSQLRKKYFQNLKAALDHLKELWI